MSKRFGRNQKRKLKAELVKLNNELDWKDNYIEENLHNPCTNAERIQVHSFEGSWVSRGDNRADPVHVHEEPLYHLEYDFHREGDINTLRKEEESMLYLKFHLANKTVGYAITESALQRMHEKDLEKCLTSHMAKLIIQDIRYNK